MEKFFYVTTSPLASAKFSTYADAEAFAKRKVNPGSDKAWILEAVAVAQSPVPAAEVTKL